MFLTCSHDRQVCLWNAEDHKLDWCISLEVGRFLLILPSLSSVAAYTHIRTTQYIKKCVHCLTALPGVRLVCGLLPQRISGCSGPLHWTVISAVVLELRALVLNWWTPRTISTFFSPHREVAAPKFFIPQQWKCHFTFCHEDSMNDWNELCVPNNKTQHSLHICFKNPFLKNVGNCPRSSNPIKTALWPTFGSWPTSWEPLA